MNHSSGKEMVELCSRLFPICRSLTGNGVRQTLHVLKEHLPLLNIQEIPSGTPCFDWRVPKEWNIREAYVIDPDGKKIIDFRESNLHVVGYSAPVDTVVTLEELKTHLHSLPDQPHAIPYVTSYYQERWGFCLSHRQLVSLKPGNYRAYIDSDLSDGGLSFGELILPGRLSREIFLSTNICHPSLANNEVSGPAVTTFIARWLTGLNDRRYTYRIIFIPETIGSIAYLSLHYQIMKKRTIAGFNVSCVGDDRSFSYLPSRHGNTLADRAALHVLKHLHPEFAAFRYLDRGSDERQYCAPGMDLPVCSVMRTKYGEYPEYHTSLDNLDLISPAGLWGAYTAIKQCIECLEKNETLKVTVLCEPHMGKRGLYPTLSTRQSGAQVNRMMNLLAYSDGKHDLLQIAEILGVPMWDLFDIVNRLKKEGILENAADETGTPDCGAQ